MKNYIAITAILFTFNINNGYAQETIDATVDWAQRVDLTIPVDGVVKEVSVNTGQIVKKGQVLVKLDSRVFRANLRQAKANVNSLKATYEEVKRELDRALELYERTVLSDHDLQVAKNNEVLAKSDLETAKADHIKAQVDFEHSSLVAPFDSIILKRSVEVGKAIINRDSYQTLITLASSMKYLAKSKLTPTQNELVSIGQAVKVITSDKTYSGNVVAIEYGLGKSVGESTLVVMFTSQDKRLHAGLKVKVIY